METVNILSNKETDKKNGVNGITDEVVNSIIKMALAPLLAREDQVEKLTKKIHEFRNELNKSSEKYINSLLKKRQQDRAEIVPSTLDPKVECVLIFAAGHEDYWGIFITYIGGCLYLLDNDYNLAASLVNIVNNDNKRLTGIDKDLIVNCMKNLVNTWKI